MAKKKAFEFQPELATPRGINNHAGTTFRCFTKGDTLPFQVTLKSVDGTIVDFTGYRVVVIFADALNVDRGECNADQELLSVEIPLVDAVGGVFNGAVSSAESQSLPAGITYGLLKYIALPIGNEPGAEYIIDMAVLEVFPNLTTIVK